jgi:hypothetical protein
LGTAIAASVVPTTAAVEDARNERREGAGEAADARGSRGDMTCLQRTARMGGNVGVCRC